MKKMTFSVMATGSLALLFGAGDAEASSSHTVKQGDSLWKIATTYQVSIADLKKWNNLTSDTIYPNQQLKLHGETTHSNSNTQSTKPTGGSSTPPSTMSVTYTVKSGDTLSQIAARHQTTIGAIQRLNNIPGHLIFPGQKLEVNGIPPTAEKPKPSTPSKPKEPSTSEKPSAPSGSYTVVKGDTLSQIAHQHGISVTQLKNWNQINAHIIQVGQVLKIENTTVESQANPPPILSTPPSQSTTATVQNVINKAMALQGVPYVWGGSTPSGFDCSGFLYYVYSQSGIDVPRTNTVGFHARSYEVSAPQIGDIVFFKNTYTTGISHAGVYLGNNKFIHAGGDRVQISDITEKYWHQHFDSFKRLYAMD